MLRLLLGNLLGLAGRVDGGVVGLEAGRMMRDGSCALEIKHTCNVICNSSKFTHNIAAAFVDGLVGDCGRSPAPMLGPTASGPPGEP